MSEQIKSKQRVADHGEVFTADREVNAMLDLVKNEAERIDSRFLEPACGEGAFLIKALERKMQTVKNKYKNNKSDFEKYSIIVLTSLYGIDLLEDNAEICRNKLLDRWKELYEEVYKPLEDRIAEVAKYILSKNIICGNALSLKKVDSYQHDTEDPIIFAEWSMVMGSKVKRRDYRLDVLLEVESREIKSFSLFDDDPMSLEYWDTDPITKELIPLPVREYPLIDYWRITEYE